MKKRDNKLFWIAIAAIVIIIIALLIALFGQNLTGRATLSTSLTISILNSGPIGSYVVGQATKPDTTIVTFNCATSSCSFSFPSGTAIILQRVLAKGGEFAGWKGACTGSLSRYCGFTSLKGSKTVSAIFKTTSLLAPGSLTSTDITSSSMTLNWAPVSGATGYKIYRQYGASYKLINSGITSNSYTMRGLTSGTTYTHKVGATNAVAESLLSTALSTAIPFSTSYSVFMYVNDNCSYAPSPTISKVVSSPAGIICRDFDYGPSNCIYSFTAPIVTLDAIAGGPVIQPLPPPYHWECKFGGWSGDCSGTETSIFLPMDNDKSCTARFYDVLVYTG